MKLYTKKMTYSLLATGLLACAPVDAFAPVPLAVAAAAAAAAARTAESVHCKRMCQGYFVHAANNKNLTGAINKKDISNKLKGIRDKRECKCTYKGDLDIEKIKTFNQKDARESGEQKELIKVREHASSEDCDQTKEMCLIKKPKKEKNRRRGL